MNVKGACELGIHALLHESTPQSIKAVDTLLRRSDLRWSEAVVKARG